jgi:hypothetical protein
MLGIPAEPGRILELLATETHLKEPRKKLQDGAVGRLVSGIEWAEEEDWVSIAHYSLFYPHD